MHARVPHDTLGVFTLIANALAPRPPFTDSFGQRNVANDTAESQAASPRQGLLERLDRWFWMHEQREVEAHLSKATDIYDLEARIRGLERGVTYRCY